MITLYKQGVLFKLHINLLHKFYPVYINAVKASGNYPLKEPKEHYFQNGSSPSCPC